MSPSTLPSTSPGCGGGSVGGGDAGAAAAATAPADTTGGAEAEEAAAPEAALAEPRATCEHGMMSPAAMGRVCVAQAQRGHCLELGPFSTRNVPHFMHVARPSELKASATAGESAWPPCAL